MRELIRLLLSISSIIPLDRVLALIQAASPLPTDWQDRLQLTAWLQRVGIVDPLAAVVVESVCQRVQAMMDTCPVGEMDIAEMVEQEAVGLDPATIAMLVSLVVQILKAIGVL